MGKVKNFGKKDKSAADFDKKNPSNRVKSINDEKMKKKQKQKKIPVVGGALEQEVKPLTKELKKEVAKALKAKKSLTEPKVVDSKPAEGTSFEVPEKLATRDVLKKAIKGAKDGIDKEKEAATTKTLFDDELRYGLQVVAVKIPKSPPHTKKILLENSLFGDDTPDICFIVRDQKAKKTNESIDEAVMKFEELLKEVGITGVTTILPLSKLKQDYGPHNMKLKLLNTYDIFLVESEIAEHAYTILGKHFIKKRKRPHQIDTSKKETMKHSFEAAKRKVSFKISGNSNFSIFEVGTHKMENGKIVDNISSAIDQLKDKWPGGWKNILRLYLKPMAPSKISIPIYYSKISPNDVEVPVEVGVKQTRLDKITEMLAKKSKKLRLDRKSKKIVKVKGQAPTDKKQKNKAGKKDKKRKLETADETTVAKEELPVPTKKSKKIKKETTEPVAKVEPSVAESSVPKLKKKKKVSVSEAAPEVAEVPKKVKKEKLVAETEQLTEKKIKVEIKKEKKSADVIEAAAEEPKKADKKKNKKNKTT